MKTIRLAVPVTAAALVAAGLVGGAGAQLPSTGNDAKAITVNGVGGGGSVSKGSGVGARKSQYAAALSDAMDDAKTKATAIAGKASVTLVGVNSVTENTTTGSCGAPTTRNTCTPRAAVTVEYAIQ